jgi:hypothetical protein
MGERRGVYRVWVGKPEGKRPLGRIILNGSSGSGMWGVWTGLIWLRIGTGGGHL